MTEEELNRLIAAYLSGDRQAGDQLYQYLKPILAATVRGFFTQDDIHFEQLIETAVDRIFGHFERNQGFEGDLAKFARKVARNACITLANRIKKFPPIPYDETITTGTETKQESSPEDILLGKETQHILQDGLDRLGRICRIVLRGFFFENKTAEEIRRETKLKTVQGVHYRKWSCIRKLAKYLYKSKGDWMDEMEP